MATVIMAVNDFSGYDGKIKIFLAGSIEKNKPENWHHHIERLLSEQQVVLLNPRRDDWDSTWRQELSDEQFRTQVEWELEALEYADYIIIFFEKNAKSPISLLEFGLFAKTGKLIVFCEDGFWRKGNVDIVCKKYAITQVSSWNEMAEFFKHIA